MPLRHPLALAPLLVLAACADDPAGSAADPAALRPLAMFECLADVRGASVSCRPAGVAPAAGRSDLMVGWQGVYVRVTATGAVYNSGTEEFSADFTVQSLLGQPMGTTDGVTPDAEGIRVFFHAGPTLTGGSGTVEVDNEDGTGTFTAGGQPFFRYSEILTTEEVSAPAEWVFAVEPTVTTFSFTLYVAAAVPHEAALQTIDLDARTLAVGGYHSCALNTTGQAYCWGNNDDGQMGSAASDSVPVAVSGGHTWRSLSAGRYHTCGVTTGDVAYCWGDNQTGQLGNPNESDSNTPVAVSGLLAWTQLSAGAAHTCGVTTSLDAYCWGNGTSGQLGGGDSIPSTPAQVAVFGGRKWAAVSAGTDHSCGVTRGGAAFCWGDNSDGELGNGGGAPTARPVLVSGDRSWRSVSAGESFACGITSLGVGMCWGLDSAGQIGNGAAPAPDEPEAVTGGFTWDRITAGRETGCGITTADDAYCWGFNNTGEIGDGTTTFSDAPVAVFGGLDWAWIDGGDYHGCGVRTTGEARCWGYNLTGQLGNNSTVNNPFPQVVSGGHSWDQ